jgi:hypothetical protein
MLMSFECSRRLAGIGTSDYLLTPILSDYRTFGSDAPVGTREMELGMFELVIEVNSRSSKNLIESSNIEPFLFLGVLASNPSCRPGIIAVMCREFSLPDYIFERL